MNEDTKLTKQIVAIDGFDGFTDERAGTGDNDAQPAPGSIIKGNLIKFTNQATWELRDGEEMPPDLELIAVDILRIVQKWIDQKPVETRILAPGEKIPDVKALNAECPKSEWHKDLNGQEQGPWQFQYVTYFLDPATMDRFTFPTATTGGSVCARDLADRVKWMRRFRPGVFAVVTLADTFMNTQYGGRQRPHYIVKRWVQMGEAAPAMSGPTPQPRITSAAEPLPGMQTVAEPPLSEQMNDEVPFNDPLPESVGGSPMPPPKPAAPSVHPMEPKPHVVTKKGTVEFAGNRR